MKEKVELLSPAGDKEALKYAILNGADAVYLAGKSFGARAFANNFDNDELKEAVEYAHGYGVKVYITVNTLVLEKELDSVIEFLDYIYLAGADAVLVQDLGLVDIIKNRYPDLELHASTQMNIQNLEQANILKKLGFKRIVLGREVDLKEIKRIKENLDIELEVFIHGALCISYSGNCYMSSLIGSRSGNRGKCAQPCRFEYTFDDQTKYFLSTKDLCTINQLQEILPYVDSLKIEGRMKGNAYIGSVTNIYRKVIDDLLKNKKTTNLSSRISELKVSFNREFTKGFLMNEDHKLITNCNSQNHLGVLAGEVINFRNNNAVINVNSDLGISINDGLRFVGKNEDAIIVNDMYINGKIVKDAKKGSSVTVKVHKKLNIGDKVFLTKKANFEDIYSGNRKVKVTGKCYVDGKNLVLTVNDGTYNVINKIEYLDTSENNISARVKEQLGKTNDTIFEFSKLDVSDLYIFIKIKDINDLRRKTLNDLYELRTKINRFIRNKPLKNKVLDINNDTEIKYNVAVTSEKQLLAVINSGFNYNEIYVRDYSLYKKYQNNNKIIFYLPRITKRTQLDKGVSSGYNNIKNNYISPYFNVTNSKTLAKLFKLGARKVGLSIELSYNDMKDLMYSFKEENGFYPNVEVMIYGYYQAMIMKHCFINKARGYQNMKCDECKKDVYLTDRYGKSYPLMGDENCNLSVLYFKPVDLFDKVESLKSIGIYNYLIDFTVEKEDEVTSVLSSFSTEFKYFGHFINNDI